MIQAIIIDDEAHCRDRLCALLEKHLPEKIKLLGVCKTVDEGIATIKEHKPDLIFLDIQIDDRIGFEVIEAFDKIDFQVIFTTAHDQYALQALRCSALDYLLKPIDVDDLLAAVEKAEIQRHKQKKLENLENLIYNLNAGNRDKKIAIPTVNGFSFVNTQEIIRCESNVNYTTIFFTNKPKMTVAKTLKEFEEMLTPYRFFRVHNSHLINLEFIQSYNKGKTGVVKLTDGSEIDVSSRRKDDFMQAIGSL